MTAQKRRLPKRWVLKASLQGALGLVVIWGILGWWSSEFPDVSQLAHQYPTIKPLSPKDPSGLPFDVIWKKSRPPSWVTLSGISRQAVGAVLVSEDWAFYQHSGYDPNQIREAIEESLKEGHLSRGASTITQQVVKNVFLSSERSLWRKIKELWLALRLERRVGKRRILETYFNIAEWGPGIYGISGAAQYYFHKHPSELTAREGAWLAILLPSPIRYGQSFRRKQLTPFAKRTINSVLLKMQQAGYLTEEARLIERETPLSFEQYTPVGESSILSSEQNPQPEVSPEPAEDEESGTP